MKKEKERLAELRSMPYEEYLLTPEWQKTRDAAIRRAGDKCQECKAEGVILDAYHTIYDNLGCEQEGDIVILCEACAEGATDEAEEEKTYTDFSLSKKAAIFAPSALVAMGLPALLHAPLPAELFGLVAAVALAYNSPKIYAEMRGVLPRPVVELADARAEHKQMRAATGEYSVWDRLLGRHMYEQEEDDEPAQLKDERDNTAERARQAAAANLLVLSADYTPHVNDVLGHALLCVGQRGTGKSNVAARLVEQLGQYPIPMVIFDYKRDYITLPQVLRKCVIAGSPEWRERHEYKHYWGLTKENAFNAGYCLMEKGIQLVFEKLAYKTIDDAAEVMILILEGMFEWALQRPAGKCIPALALLDEAQQFLPQNTGISTIDPEISKRLFSVFEQLNSVGRSLGFTPAFFTQRIAQLRKEVIGGSELYWLLRQSQSVDLEVYEKLVGKENIDRRAIQSQQAGDALVFENGELDATHFYERESEHLSVTPVLEDALAFYSNREITTSLDSPNSRSQYTPSQEAVLSVAGRGDLLTRERVNSLVEPGEHINQGVNSDEEINGVNEDVSAKFTNAQAAEVLKAYRALVQDMKGEIPSRRALRDYLHANVSVRWNTNPKNYATFQAICNEYGL